MRSFEKSQTASQVSFISIVLYIIQTVWKQLHSDKQGNNVPVMQTKFSYAVKQLYKEDNNSSQQFLSFKVNC